MTHLETREFLRSLRRSLAQANDIPWIFAVPLCQEDCKGDCPACQTELRYLESELNQRAAQGKSIILPSPAAAAEEIPFVPVAEVVTPSEPAPRGDMALEELGLSLRTRVSLDGHGITGVRQLRQMSVSDLKKVRNMTQEGLDEIAYQLGLLGFTLEDE